MREKLKKYKSNSLLGVILLATLCILAQYLLPIMSIGLVLVSAYSIFRIFQGGKLVINYPLTLFIIFALVSQLFIYILGGTLAINRNTYLFIVVSIFLIYSMSSIDKDVFLKIYSIVGLISSLIIIFQFFDLHFNGDLQSAIKIFPVATEDNHFWITDSTRISGIFTEPQAFCSYILPLLILLLYKGNIIFSVFLSIAILMTTSSQGILLCIFIWCYYILFGEKNRFRKIVFISCGLCGVLFIINTSLFQEAITKIFSINLSGYDIRITKGFQIYFSMPFLDKLIGIGDGNLANYLRQGDFSFFWMELTRPDLFAYVTTMSAVLISFGAVGFIYYNFALIKNFWNSQKEARLLLLILFISTFTQTILFNVWFIFYWTVFCIYDQENSHNYVYISFNKMFH